MRYLQSHRAVRPASHDSSEDGFLLLGAIVAIALVLIVLAIAAPRVARSLRRDREVEAVHRGQQYVRAIQLYYRKFGHYPASVDQLEHANLIRFLRQRYTDPITGKDDFVTIAVGHNKTTVKTFFGEPLAGLPAGGPGSVAGMLSTGMGQAGGTAGAGGPGSSPSLSFGANSSGGFGGSNSTAAPAAGAGGAASFGAPASGTPAGTVGSPASGGAGPAGAAGAAGAGAAAAPGAGAAGSTSPTDPGVGSQSATGFSGSGQPFMGVSLGAHGDSIVEYNAQTTLESWEFLYDPRLDQLKAKAAALNGGPGSVPTNSLGGAFGQPGAPGAPGAPGTTPPAGTPGATPTAPTTPAAPPTIGVPLQPLN